MARASLPAGTPFGIWLRQRRKALDLTQEQLAAAIDVSLPTIVKIEAGQRRPSHQVAELLARCLEVPPEEQAAFMRLARTPLQPSSESTTSLPPLPAAHLPAELASPIDREQDLGQPGCLPTPLTSFVGREREIAAISDLMQAGCLPAGGCRVVSLIGPGGSGKTRLAIQVARLLTPEYRHGAWWVDLSSLRYPALVPDAALRALGMTPAPGQPTMQALISFLRERSLLLLLDNCEHLLEACAHMVAAVLQACPAVCVLATSREPLGVPGEQLWPVPTFSVPAPDADLDAESLLGYDAVRLFLDRARMHRPAFELTGDNAAQVAEICRRLDGIPLAIELAAARVRTMDLQDILARLQHRLRLLASTSALASPRQQTLRASIDWSYNLLSPAECLLLQRLAIFVGGCTLVAAEAVCMDGGLAEEQVLDLLTRLVDRSLVVAEGGRYLFLETIREYALERLIDTGAAEALRERHAAYFADYLGEQYDVILSGEQHQAIVEIAGEIGNVRAAWAWAVTAHRYDLLSRSANGLTWYFELHSRFHEGEVAYGRAVEALSGDPDADRDVLARLHTHHGYFLDRLGRLDEAHREGRGVAQRSARRIYRVNWRSL
jgi:predicted ATPase/transcriptional regulator with XRE-family HTH domain